jgi:hypothetical protein
VVSVEIKFKGVIMEQIKNKLVRKESEGDHE